MNINIPQLYFSKLMRAIVEFDLIAEHDRILIGLSGGKDSLFLAYALSIMQKRLIKPFSLAAVTINTGFTSNFPYKTLKTFSEELSIPYEVIDIDIKGAIAAQNGKDPCFTCAFLRRGAINNYAKQNKFNKVAYAHHHDDAVETFFMSLLYSGQLQTFAPKTYLDRTDITVIRPLVYMREKEIIEAQSLLSIDPIPSACPYDGKTMRQKTKEIIKNLAIDNNHLYDHLASAMRLSALKDLWPATKTRNEMKETYYAYMNNRRES